MTKEEAQFQLRKGYIIAIISFLIFLLITAGTFSNKLYISLIAAYWLWGIYWGIKIVSPFVAGIFNANVIYTNLWDSIKGNIIKKFWLFSIVILLGTIVGILGGAFYKQIKLMMICYT